MAQEEWRNSWNAVESTMPGGVVQLSLDGVVVQAATIAVARLALAEGIRDQYDDDYGNVLYQLWGFVRQPVARFELKVIAYEESIAAETDPVIVSELNNKLARLRLERAKYRQLDRNPPIFTTPPPTTTQAPGPPIPGITTTTPPPVQMSAANGRHGR
jgi:hypothetical protein